VTLTADPADDFGINAVRFYDGARVLSTQQRPPFSQAVTIPAAAACGATKTFTATVVDSASQTKMASVGVSVSCPEPTATPTATAAPQGETHTLPIAAALAAPTITWLSKPTKFSAPRAVGFAVSAPAGVHSTTVTLGLRTICTTTAMPVLCRLTPTGEDVGVRTLRAVVTDAAGRSAEVSNQVRVAKFAPRALRLNVVTHDFGGGVLRRTITGTLKPPAAVNAAQGCSGTVTVVIRRAGRAFLNQQVPLSKSCRFTRSVTASHSGHFTVSASPPSPAAGGSPDVRACHRHATGPGDARRRRLRARGTGCVARRGRSAGL
jgi:hypothetical protein